MKYPSLLLALVTCLSICTAQESRNTPMYDSGVDINGEIEHPSNPAWRVEKLSDMRDSVNRSEWALPRDAGSKPGTGTASVAQLMHRVPAGALKDYHGALKAVRKKDNDGAIALLKKAVAIDPEFVEAQTDLGRLYVQKRDPDNVLAAFHQVLKMNPRSDVAYTCSSVALIWLQRFPDAEASARKALSLNPASVAGHYLLGFSLAEQHKDDEEAMDNLNKSISLFPDARIKAAAILARLKTAENR